MIQAGDEEGLVALAHIPITQMVCNLRGRTELNLAREKDRNGKEFL